MFKEILVSLARELDKKSIPYMIIGGQAVLLYGRPRVTQDIDITLGIDASRSKEILSISKALKLKILSKNPYDFIKNTNVLPTIDPKSKIRVDFIFSYTAYETTALKKAKGIKILNYRVKFASAEDLIIHKLFAGREIDKEDAKSIVLKQGKKLNKSYIRKWLKEFSKLPERENMLLDFKSLIR